jgi:hypothetical protein
MRVGKRERAKLRLEAAIKDANRARAISVRDPEISLPSPITFWPVGKPCRQWGYSGRQRDRGRVVYSR